MMGRFIEGAAIANFENWGGKWTAAPEFRKEQSRREVTLILDALLSDNEARAELFERLGGEPVAWLRAETIRNLSGIQPTQISKWKVLDFDTPVWAALIQSP